MPDDLQPSPSPGPPDFGPSPFEECPYCHQPTGAIHRRGCPGRQCQPLSVRLTIAEYDRLCLIARREEQTIRAVVKRAVRLLIKQMPVPPRKSA